MPDTLILIDIQRDYFPGGRFPLAGRRPRPSGPRRSSARSGTGVFP